MLVANIGNTHTQIAPLAEADIGPVRTLSTEALLETGLPPDLAGMPAERWLVASVVPAAGAILRRALAADSVRFLDVSMIRAIDFRAVDASTLGADRLANAVAAVHTSAAPVVVLECGTAITTELIDADCRFRGGVILPGRRLQRTSLHLQTAQLPDVDLDSAGLCTAASCTTDAIRAGVDLGLLGAVSRILEVSRRELSTSDCEVLAIGGDAPFFLRHLPGLRPAPTAFTLRGLAAVARNIENC